MWSCKSKRTQKTVLTKIPAALALAGMLAVGNLALSTNVHALPLAQSKVAGAMNAVDLRVLVEPKNAPFAFLYETAGQPLGFDVELMYELQRKLGFNLIENRFFPVESYSGFRLLSKNEADVFIGGNVSSAELDKDFDMTKSVVQSGFSFLYSANNPNIKSTSDLKGKHVAVKRGSPVEEYVTKVLGANAIAVDNITMAYYKVSSGQLDAVVAERPLLTYFADTMPSFNLKVDEAIFNMSDGNYVFYLPKDSPYTALFNQALRELEADGTIYRLKRKWFHS